MDSKNEPVDNPRLALIEVPLLFQCFPMFFLQSHKTISYNFQALGIIHSLVTEHKHNFQAVCISFFTVEFLLRLAGSPDKRVFLKYKLGINNLTFLFMSFKIQQWLAFFSNQNEFQLPTASLMYKLDSKRKQKNPKENTINSK